MRIDSTKWVNMPKTYERNQPVEGTETKRMNRTDEVTISKEARVRFEGTTSSRADKIAPLNKPFRMEPINRMRIKSRNVS